MQKKHVFLLAFLGISVFIFSLDLKDFEGSWINNQNKNFILESSKFYFSHKREGYKIPRSASLVVIFNHSVTGFDFIKQEGVALSLLIKDKILKGDTLKLLCTYSIYSYNEELVQKECHIDMVFIDDDEVIINGIGDVYTTFLDNQHWYRISGPAKIPPQDAVLNNSRVRLRVKPNLEANICGFLDKDEPVILKDKSAEPFTIAGENWYWYKVESEHYPDGWVYGKYLDIKD